MIRMKFCLFFFLFIFAPVMAQAVKGLQGLTILRSGKSLAVEEENDFLVSPKGTFSGGFYKVGTNAYCFSVWFTNSVNRTVVWMANRDAPVNGRQSKLSLYDTGNMVLTDADGSLVWSTQTNSIEGVELQLLETGNLVLISQEGGVIWQSFDSPTDTLLPSQPFTKNITLVSARSPGTYSSGFYNLKFSDDNAFTLIYNGPLISSSYWPDTTLSVISYGRSPYNSSRLAVLNEFGHFSSSDSLKFNASDYGIGPKRRLTLDSDGIYRLYSLDETTGLWQVSWLPGGLDACQVHGLCGVYGVCGYNPQPFCTCPMGFTKTDPSDWSKGCSPTFNLTCDPAELDFVELHHTDYDGFDMATYATGVSLEACRNSRLNDCRCKGFGYALNGQGQCFPKKLLLNGFRMPDNRMIIHVKVPKGLSGSIAVQEELTTASDMKCSAEEVVLSSHGINEERSGKGRYMKYLIGFVAAFGAIEIVCIGLGSWFAFRKRADEESMDMGYKIVLSMGFKRFTYVELKRATKNFKQEIGKGGFGAVYKGVLDDRRPVAVKRLEGVVQGESQFWAEVSIIGKINHRNLVKLWGFCAENEHKLLVYEYMENGSLDKILLSDSSSRTLDWEHRYNIAIGTAKGLSYLHEECLEWILHCDVKPQNILLDDQFEPKVADFGMSKLFIKDNINDRGFSRVRGTRGYLAPEWMMNLRIDAKADVYSYGIVLLELLSGKNASSFKSATDEQENECNDLVQWVIRKMRNVGFEEVIDPGLESGSFDRRKLERLLNIALLCVEEDRNARPTMSKVVELLLGYGNSGPDEDVSDLGQ